MSETKKVWSSGNNKLRLNYPVVEINKLDNVIYSVGIDDYGFFLYKTNDIFEFGYKIYGLDETGNFVKTKGKVMILSNY